MDDEATIRKGLRETIAWNELQVEIIGEASNGQEALQLLRSLQADVVLTDIKMPVMDGLEFAEMIKHEGIHTHIIMISGYDDFEYAVQALRLGVKDYLLKPVDIDLLIEIVKKVRHEQAEFEQDSFLKWLTHEINGTSDEHDWANRNPLFVKNKPFHVICSQLSDYSLLMSSTLPAERNEVGRQMREVIGTSFRKAGLECTSAFIHPNQLITILFMEEHAFYSAILEKLWELHRQWKGPHRLLFTVSQQFSRAEEIRMAYLQASAMMESPVLCQSPVLENHSVRDSAQLPMYSPLTQIGQLLNCFIEQNRQGILDVAERIFMEFAARDLTYSDVYAICKKIITILEARLRELGKSTTVKLRFDHPLDVLIYNSYAQIRNVFVEDLTVLYINVIAHNETSKSNSLIEKAKSFIIERLFDEIKAAEVAEHIHVTPNYFSFIFKQAIGKNFNEYVNELRVDKAKEFLLCTDEKVFEIAERVGFHDYKHFVYVFKKMTGATPSIYRECFKK